MRLTLIGPVYPYRGGIAHFTTMLVKRLEKQGIALQVISFRNQYPSWAYPGESDKDFREGRVKVKAEYLLSMLNPMTWCRTIRSIKAFNPEKVVIQWWVTLWAPAFWALARWLKRAGVNVTYIIHNTMPHEPRLLDKFFTKLALKNGYQFIVMNEEEVERLKPFVTYKQNVIVCTLPLFSMFPEINQSKKEVRNLLDLPQDYKLILFFGIVRQYKGLSVLLSAISFMKKAGVEKIGLVIVGEFWEKKQRYLDEIRSLNISDCVWIEDRYISDLETSQYFKATDLFVAPYVGGTQSASVKTAMHFGKPIVVTDVIADEMIRRNIDQDFIVPPNDASLLASAITNRLEMPQVLKTEYELENSISWECIEKVLLG